MSQEKKIALVTGATKGIGFEIARQLGEQGMLVLIGARARGDEAARKLQEEGIEARAIMLDLCDQRSIDTAARLIEDTYARLDVLVNNAAVVAPEKALPSKQTPDSLRFIYETNVFGTFAVTQAMIPLLRRSPAGRIVNMTSGLASLSMSSEAPADLLLHFSVAYSSSKAAVNAFTIYFAKELEQAGIKVNAADPGRVATDMNPTATRTPRQGAAVAVQLATLSADGPTGGFFDEKGRLPW
uniref:Dehydrogenase n=1 Tax=Thermosporothrix sp. COM3 TaxID=2490863 RepID=A0A455SGF2_9CHLR|nr:dehydrogenase [Thermosporothrix sp. COM3]